MVPFQKLCKSLEYLVDCWGQVEGRARLMKLIYLADLAWARTNGTQYPEANYHRWNHGPFSREVLHALEWMDGIEVVESAGFRDGDETSVYRSGASTRLAPVELDSAFFEILDRIGDRWRNRPLRDLDEHVYRGKPFRGKAFGEPLL